MRKVFDEFQFFMFLMLLIVHAASLLVTETENDDPETSMNDQKKSLSKPGTKKGAAKVSKKRKADCLTVIKTLVRIWFACSHFFFQPLLHFGQEEKRQKRLEKLEKEPKGKKKHPRPKRVLTEPEIEEKVAAVYQRGTLQRRAKKYLQNLQATQPIFYVFDAFDRACSESFGHGDRKR